ncbi:LysR family transcriptional regulator [Nereida sp. MMG025]|uniref:LysR family transcriptional regulator n=1 Tax=Nereida sp. MMG025 TaxID=2909981 RepID=UPI001EFFCE48|nr:LysR family transcriptional regulator [Nereida sp. MMG025]MCF6443946.1 LysR family transcriptional regulator [Nereida sp. MMG025]
MARNLDITALRSFVAVANTGGVTKAAGFLNLTQSAVSMQLKRLEESMDVRLFDRANRTVALTAQGEQLLGYARRMIALNDEIYSKLTSEVYEGEIRLGVPHDIIHPYVPQVLRQFAAEFPRMRLQLISQPTRRLREMFSRGEVDVIVTTESKAGDGGEVLVELPLVWIGARDGNAWRQNPLPVAFCTNCIFRSGVLRALDGADIAWDMVVESDLDNAVEAVVSADLAVNAGIVGHYPKQTIPLDHKGVLPDPGTTQIILYTSDTEDAVAGALRMLLRRAYQGEVSLKTIA